MESRVEKALERRDKGYNCAQAVACTYCDLIGITEETAFKMAEGFGLGMGGMNGVCGALSGAVMILSALESNGLEQAAGKKPGVGAARKIAEEFCAKSESMICREIKGVDTGVMKMSCADCVAHAASVLEKQLEAKGL